ncbi:MAG: hypothetical protein QXT37_06050 [Thermofilaceae archaeon]
MERLGGTFFRLLAPLRRAPGPRAPLREELLPAAPSLSGAFALANTLAAGHPLGFARQGPVAGVRELSRAKPCVKVGKLYRVAVVTSRQGGPPRLEVSWRGVRLIDRLQTALSALRSFPRGVAIVAEVAGVPPLLEMVQLPWFALSDRAERMFAPGFHAYLRVAGADLRGDREILLIDWREPPPGEARLPRPREMLLYAGRGDGSVFYAAVLNASRLAEG